MPLKMFSASENHKGKTKDKRPTVKWDMVASMKAEKEVLRYVLIRMLNYIPMYFTVKDNPIIDDRMILNESFQISLNVMLHSMHVNKFPQLDMKRSILLEKKSNASCLPLLNKF